MGTRKWIWVCVSVTFLGAGNAAAESSPALSVKGLVEHPVTFTLGDLATFQSVTVQLNEVMKNGDYRGAFFYRGVPLRDLLQVAKIQKKRKNFFKGIDLALAVRDKTGGRVVLSRGEVFYRNPATVLVAFSAEPIMPHGDCKSCHTPDVYRRWLDPLSRKIGFPKLVVTNDNWSDRSLDDVAEIEILDLSPDLPSQKLKRLYSAEFEISGPGVNPTEIRDLSSFPRKQTTITQMGEGKGYHGTKEFGGATFKAVVEHFSSGLDVNGVFLVSAPDGYRSILSYGEVFLSRDGERVLLADETNNAPIEEDGKFILIFPDDLMADRWVKAVQKIQWIPLPAK
jgi:hypothetical protein